MVYIYSGTRNPVFLLSRFDHSFDYIYKTNTFISQHNDKNNNYMLRIELISYMYLHSILDINILVYHLNRKIYIR